MFSIYKAQHLACSCPWKRPLVWKQGYDYENLRMFSARWMLQTNVFLDPKYGTSDQLRIRIIYTGLSREMWGKSFCEPTVSLKNLFCCWCLERLKTMHLVPLKMYLVSLSLILYCYFLFLLLIVLPTFLYFFVLVPKGKRKLTYKKGCNIT